MHPELVHRSLGALVSIACSIGVVGSVVAARKCGNDAFLFGVVVGVIGIGYGWRRLFPNYYEPIPIAPDDPLIVEASNSARGSINTLRLGLTEGKKEALIKFPLHAKNGEVEHIWGVVHSMDEMTASVSLANEPVNELECNDPRISVLVSDLEDWMLIDSEGNVEGGYSHLAMAKVFKRDKGYLPRALRMELSSFQDLDMSEV